MLRTEEEAKKCWCPFSRDSNTGGNRGSNTETGHLEPPRFMCIGSKCMAWRWAPEPERLERSPNYRPYLQEEAEPARPNDVPETWEWVPASIAAKANKSAHWRAPAEDRRGYCGLATIPQAE